MILKTNPYRMKCLVVDDESIAVKGIANYIGKLDFLEVAASCSSASEAAEILRNKEIDLMFLDINMPRLSGLDFLESLDKPPLTIITTAYSEYALDGFRLHVTDYLMKPIAFSASFRRYRKHGRCFSCKADAKKQRLRACISGREIPSSGLHGKTFFTRRVCRTT